MVAVLIVCLGNICRSPAAEAILRGLAEDEGLEDIHIESCGMGEWHVGNLPDPRMRHAAEQRGILLTSRAQQFRPEFLDAFDYILAVDDEILHDLHHYATRADLKSKIHMLTDYSDRHSGQNVPDPYYEGTMGFERVLDMLEDCCMGLVEHLKKGKAGK